MSLESDRVTPETSTAVDQPPKPPKRWQRRLLTICFGIFAFEVGLFLVIFPWQDSWTFNYFQGLNPAFSNLWDEPSFKGLITGLGFVNIYIAILQIFRLFRRSSTN